MGKHRLSDDRPARRPPVAPAPPAAPPDWPHVQANGNGTADAHAGQPTVPAAPFTPLPAGPPHATTRRHNGVPAPPGLTGSIAAQPRSLFRNRSFRLLFSAAAVSMFGTQVSLLALPLVAVIALNATPVQVGVLGTVSTAAVLLIGLP